MKYSANFAGKFALKNARLFVLLKYSQYSYLFNLSSTNEKDKIIEAQNKKIIELVNQLNLTKNESYQGEPFPEFMQKIIDSDGLIGYIKNSQQLTVYR